MTQSYISNPSGRITSFFTSSCSEILKSKLAIVMFFLAFVKNDFSNFMYSSFLTNCSFCIYLFVFFFSRSILFKLTTSRTFQNHIWKYHVLLLLFLHLSLCLGAFF